MRARYRIRVVGRVQGVFFRWSAKEEAERLGIRGFARNDEDGAVTIEAEGEREALERFIAWCKRGPALAEVASASVQEVPPAAGGPFEGFIVY